MSTLATHVMICIGIVLLYAILRKSFISTKEPAAADSRRKRSSMRGMQDLIEQYIKTAMTKKDFNLIDSLIESFKRNYSDMEGCQQKADELERMGVDRRLGIRLERNKVSDGV